MPKKILATVGPTSLKKAVLQECEKLGVHLFRINLSHTRLDHVAEHVEKIQNWTSVPVCLDSEGAQLRNQDMKEKKTHFQKGESVKIHFSPILGDERNISFTPLYAVEQFKLGDVIKVDFYGFQLRIVSRSDDYFVAEVLNSGFIGSNKAADINRDINFKAITKKDKAAIQIGRKMGVRHFALSFASSADDVCIMRKLCGSDSTIISKIESLKALLNLNEILDNTDEILIDRGDLSRQVSLEMIPFLQRRIIALAKANGTPVHVATNLLESMVVSMEPTRAELNDVVSTILMGADGLVLAAETAIGQFPEASVRTVKRLIENTDKWTRSSSVNEILSF